MRGIKRPCELVVIEYYSTESGFIYVGNSISKHESITAAEKELKVKKESGIAVCFSSIIPDKDKK